MGDEDHPLIGHLGLVIRLDVDNLPDARVAVLRQGPRHLPNSGVSEVDHTFHAAADLSIRQYVSVNDDGDE